MNHESVSDRSSARDRFGTHESIKRLYSKKNLLFSIRKSIIAPLHASEKNTDINFLASAFLKDQSNLRHVGTWTKKSVKNHKRIVDQKNNCAARYTFLVFSQHNVSFQHDKNQNAETLSTTISFFIWIWYCKKQVKIKRNPVRTDFITFSVSQ